MQDLASDMERVAARTVDWMRKDGERLDEAEIYEATAHAYKHSNPDAETLLRLRAFVHQLLNPLV